MAAAYSLAAYSLVFLLLKIRPRQIDERIRERYLGSKCCRDATTVPVNSRDRFLLIYATLNSVYITLSAHLGLATAVHCRFILHRTTLLLVNSESSTQTTVVVFDDRRAFELQICCRSNDIKAGAQRLRVKRELQKQNL